MAINENKHPERLEVAASVERKVAYCRCWQSKNFPFCDGSHRAYNQAHGEAMGPLVLIPKTEMSCDQ